MRGSLAAPRPGTLGSHASACSDERKVPQGRLSRFARLAATGVRSGAGLLFDRDGGSAAKHAAEALGTLRGLAAKIGQMASYVDGLVPEEHRQAYETALSALRAQAPTSSPAAIRAAVEEDLGAPIAELFAEWDATPVASASIGQVHRARMKDGLEVAVKVQHPGIERAVESDLGSASMLETLAAVGGGRRFKTDEVLAVIKAALPRGARLRARSRAHHVLRERARRGPHRPRAAPHRVAIEQARPHDRVRPRRDVRRGVRRDRERASRVGRDALALRLQGEPRRRQVQRRPAPRQLHLPRRRQGHVPRLRLRAGHRPGAATLGAPDSIAPRSRARRTPSVSPCAGCSTRSQGGWRTWPSTTRAAASSPSSNRLTG